MIQLTRLSLNALVVNYINTHNQNCVVLENSINALNDLIATNSKTVSLTARIPSKQNGSAEMSALYLTAEAGIVFSVNPNGGNAVAALDVSGILSLVKVAASGTGDNKSTFADANFSGAVGIDGGLTVNSHLNMLGSNSKSSWKYRSVTVTSSMTGAGATNPLDISKDYIIHLDYNNSGAALPNNSEIKLDTSGLSEGQIVKFYCLRENSGGQRIFNGTTGAEVFAYINPSSGMVSISAATKPTFSPAAAPDGLTYMVCQWTNIGGNQFRLLVIESKNVTNVG